MAGKPGGKEEPKVMDVSRPGKGKIIVNSRPLAAPVVNDKAESGDVVSAAPAAPETAPVMAPSAAKKVIQPISVISEPETDDTPEPAAEPAPAEANENKPTEENSPDGDPSQAEPVPETPAPEPAEDKPTEKPEEPAAEPEPSSTDNLPGPKADDSPISPAAPATDQSGAASVDELAKAAEQKRLAGEKSKEEAERDQKVQELISSKQYNVPISHGGSSSSKLPLVVVLVLVVAAAAGYLMADMGVFGSGIKLPFEIFKESEPAAETTQTTTPPADTQQEDKAEEETSQQTGAPAGSAEDDERKTEIRALQTKLEAYFNEEGAYPASLTDIEPTLTEDEATDPDGVEYTYTPKADKLSYALSIKLSDGTTYTLNSVNQSE